MSLMSERIALLMVSTLRTYNLEEILKVNLYMSLISLLKQRPEELDHLPIIHCIQQVRSRVKLTAYDSLSAPSIQDHL